MRMLAWLVARVFGKWCSKHHIGYRSDFCGGCMKERVYREEVLDRRRIAKSEAAEGSWPITRPEVLEDEV